MKHWKPTAEQKHQWEEKGFFIEHNVVPESIAFDMRGVIKNELLKPEPSGNPNPDPMDPMGDTPEARALRFRKLGNFCVESPLIWPHISHRQRNARHGAIFFGQRHHRQIQQRICKTRQNGQRNTLAPGQRPLARRRNRTL